MNFVGYVQLRRGILEHLVDGRLSNTEALVLMCLIMLADKATGKGTINAPTLRTFLPGLSYDAAKRALLSLEEKQYIFRHITPFSKLVYPYWVNRYLITNGPRRMLQIDLSQVFESGDIADIRYVSQAPDSAPEDAPEGAPDPALNYKKGEKKINKKEPSGSLGPIVNDSACKPLVEAMPITETALARHTSDQACALLCAPHVNNVPDKPDRTAPSDRPVSDRQTADSATPVQCQNLSPIEFGLVQARVAGLKWDAQKNAFVDVATGTVPSHDEGLRRLTKAQDEPAVRAERMRFAQLVATG